MPKRRNWGSGEVIPPAAPGGSWAVRWREQDGERRYQGRIRSKVEAQKLLAKVLGDLALDRAGLPRDPRDLPTLDSLAAGWLERRQHTHRSWGDDRGRWKIHLSPHFGKLRAPAVDTAAIRAFVEAKLRAGTNKTTIGLCVRCLSTFFSDLCERPRETGATLNPVAGLPKSLRRMYRSEHDHRFTPYLRRLADVRRLYQSLPEPVSIAYAIGVCAGLRTGEILALGWDDVDEDAPRIDVRRQIQNGAPCPPKDGEARIVTGDFLAPLVPALKAWRLKSGGRGLLFPAPRGERLSADYFTPQRLYEPFHPAAAALGVELGAKPWYHATRHTFASHWVRAGHPLGQLAVALGHSTTWVTDHYAHVEAGESEDPWALDLARREATVVPLENGQNLPKNRSAAAPSKQRGRGLISKT
jgi:integrase